MTTIIKMLMKAAAMLAVCFTVPTGFTLAQNTTPLQDIKSLRHDLQRPTEILPLPKEAPAGEGIQADMEQRYTLKSVSVYGGTVFSREELTPFWQKWIGTVVSTDNLNNIANALSTRYRNSGYFLTAVYPQVQNLPSGENDIELRLMVTEGYVDRFDILTEEGGEPDLERISAYMQPVMSSRPLKIETLERALLLINDMPGVTAKSIIRPSAVTPGAASVVLVTEQDLWSADLSATNRINTGYGPVVVGGSLTGNYGSNQVRLNFAGAQNGDGENGRLRYANIQYQRLVGSAGGAVEMSASASNTRQPLELLPVSSEGETVSGRLGYQYPFLRTRKSTVFGFAELRREYQSSNILWISTLDETVWSLHTEVSAQMKRPGYTTQLNFSVVKGLNIFDASQPGDSGLSRVNGRPDFLLFFSELSHLRSVGNGFLGYADVAFQYSPDTLLSGQEFAVGGPQFGRGYLNQQIYGDNGIAMKFELSKPFAWKGEGQIIPYSYVDGGTVWKHGGDRQSLISAGVGARSQFERGLGLDVSLNRPVWKDTSVTGGNNWLLIATLGWKF